MLRVIGIDFGTSTTYMNVKRYRGSEPAEDKFSYMPVVFNYGESSGYVASIVRENADGSFDFGEKASEELEGSRIYTEVKMRLESDDETERREARRITREFFRYLYETYKQQSANLGSPDDSEETVVSYPVKWCRETADFMLEAAGAAGFKNVRGMDEATAAVSTVMCQSSGETGLMYSYKSGHLLLIDMGAGTTDLVVCRYMPSGNSVNLVPITNWPRSSDEPTFGGREIDAVLERYVENYITNSAANPMIATMAHDLAAKKGEAKKWKELNVSVNLRKGERVNSCGYISAFRKMLSRDFPSFDRADFEKLIESGLNDYAALIKGCLDDAAKQDKSFKSVDLVILTGGHSAWYFAKEMLSGGDHCIAHPALSYVQEDKNRIIGLTNPQSTVSLGLIYSKLPLNMAKSPVREEAKKGPEKKTETKTEKPPIKEQPTRHTGDFVAKISDGFIISDRGYAFVCRLISGGLAVGDTAVLLGKQGVIRSARITGLAKGSERVAKLSAVCEASVLFDGMSRNEAKGALMLTADSSDCIEEGLRILCADNPEPVKKDIRPIVRQYYEWDDTLLPIARKFILHEPLIKNKNELGNELERVTMMKNFGIPEHEKVFYIHNWGTNILTNYKMGQIICESGFYARYRDGLKYKEIYLSWESFVNAEVTKSDMGQVFSFGNTRMALSLMSDSFERLQELLRENARPLQD